MSIFITEGRLPNGCKVYFKCKTDDAGIVVEKQIYHCEVKQIPTSHGRDLAIFDSTGRIRVRPTVYIQELRANKPITTRRQMAVALNFLYMFCDIYNVDPENMSGDDVQRFMQFLMGTFIRPEPYMKVTHRSPHTVNVYLGYIRKYYDTYHICMDGFKLQSTNAVKMPRLSDLGGSYTPSTKIYRTEATDPKRKSRQPKHIRPFELEKIVKLMEAKDDTCSLCLCILMYGYGLRAGEALGLTTEDMCVEESNGVTSHKLILRNRISDNRDQYCKGLYHPKDSSEYQSRYWLDSFAYITIAERHYALLEQYYFNSRYYPRGLKSQAQVEKYYKNLNTYTKADATEKKFNHYLFICKNGKRLSLQTWNYTLKQYYTAAGVVPDRGRRYLNASHRLRHGFAMWYAHYCSNPVTIIQLAKMLRHSSITSTEKYYTMTPEDELKIRTQHNLELHEYIPYF
ncbi:MAG: site-specific integrase [Bacteroidales bacterium]|nr:site-specific integrase [Bacteroidales bacterium]